MKKLLSLVIALSIFVVSSSICYADSKDTVKVSSESADDYSTYLETNKDFDKNVEDIYADINMLSVNGAATETVAEFEGKKPVVKWNDGKGSITFSFNVLKDGLYNIAVGYYMLEGDTEAAELSLLVDGKEPFEGVKNISLPRLFADDGEVRADGIGNEFAPEQKEVFAWQEKRLTDIEGLNSKPYLFALKAGKHTVTLYDCSTAIAFSHIKLCAEEKAAPYSEVLKLYEEKGYKNYEGKQLEIQAENAYLKSSYNLISQSDATSANVYPYDALAGKVNYIGGNNWSGAGDTISWKLNAPSDGLYAITFAYQQSYLVNGSAYRVLRVDGEIPFAEAEEIDFNYCNSWKQKVFADESGKPYLIYLTAGEHTLSLEVTEPAYSRNFVKLTDTNGEWKAAPATTFTNLDIKQGENVLTLLVYGGFELEIDNIRLVESNVDAFVINFADNGTFTEESEKPSTSDAYEIKYVADNEGLKTYGSNGVLKIAPSNNMYYGINKANLGVNFVTGNKYRLSMDYKITVPSPQNFYFAVTNINGNGNHDFINYEDELSGSLSYEFVYTGAVDLVIYGGGEVILDNIVLEEFVNYPVLGVMKRESDTEQDKVSALAYGMALKDVNGTEYIYDANGNAIEVAQKGFVTALSNKFKGELTLDTAKNNIYVKDVAVSAPADTVTISGVAHNVYTLAITDPELERSISVRTYVIDASGNVYYGEAIEYAANQLADYEFNTWIGATVK